jgi:hypothetical protein
MAIDLSHLYLKIYVVLGAFGPQQVHDFVDNTIQV